METDLMHGCATRHAQSPLPQPLYQFRHVPTARRDLQGSKLIRIDNNRVQFHEAMGEMVLLCKEAMRRRKRKKQPPPVVAGAGGGIINNGGAVAALPPTTTGGGSKPLSLEYLADRLDIDDPCFGYLVRTSVDLTTAAGGGDGDNDNDDEAARQPSRPSSDASMTTWKRGMLQGFITVTTFTNWQHSFRWDSFHPAAYESDTPESIEGRPERVRDSDGTLARALQNTVHCGDILNEGIVWPRIAEISLLGGLGCGKALVEMIIEQLECFQPTPTQNYDYVVLQATENSIPFYESIGFVRVGAIMLGGDAGRKESVIHSFISSDYETYEVSKTGETLTKIAAKFGVDVLDVIFLNQHVLQNAKPSSKPITKTVLMIPKQKQPSGTHGGGTSSNDTAPSAKLDDVKWHVAKENETPRGIAHLYSVKISSLVQANRGRFPDLLANSRLRAGTRLKVSHFDVLETEYKAYAHWSFPDKLFEDPEPSYMMARQLHRRALNERHVRPFQASLQAELCEYEKPELLLPPSPQRFVVPTTTMTATTPGTTTTVMKKKKKSSAMKKRPLTPYMAFAQDVRGKTTTGHLDARDVRQLWNDLSPIDKAHFEELARESREQQQQLSGETAAQGVEEAGGPASAPAAAAAQQLLLSTTEKAQWALYNKVVRLRPDAITEHSEYTYWYVLTFIPDLKWCHLAPMYQDGVFGPDKPRVAGQPRWRLVNEELGQEVDISSSYCFPIKSRSMRKTLDADKEEWHIIDDDGTDNDPPAATTMAPLPITPRDFSRDSNRLLDQHSSLARKSSVPPIQESPSLLALLPESTCITTVTIVGQALFNDDDDDEIDDDPQPVVKKRRGRPNKHVQPAACCATEPRPRHHARKRPTVQFDLPASARKAAALRTAAGMDPKQTIDYSKENATRRKSAPPNVGGSTGTAGLLDPSTLKQGPGRPPKRKRHDPVVSIDSSATIFGEDGANSSVGSDSGRTMGDEKTDYFAPLTLSSRLRTKITCNNSLSDSVACDQVLESPKEATQKIKILPILQKTADATEYFEPVVFESRLRNRSGLSPARALAQRPSATVADGANSSVGSDSERTMGDEKTDYFAPPTLSSRLQTKTTCNNNSLSDSVDCDHPLEPPKEATQKIKILPILQKTADATEYFEPVVFDSRLRNRSGLSPARPLAQRTSATVAEKESFTGSDQEGDSDYFTPVIVDSRLRRKSLLQNDDSAGPPSQAMQQSKADRYTVKKIGTIDKSISCDDSVDSFVPMSDQVRPKKTDRGKELRIGQGMESGSSDASSREGPGDYFAPVILKSRLRQNHSDPSSATASGAHGTKGTRALERKSTATNSDRSSTDYFAPVIINSRLRHRSQKEDDLEQDEGYIKQNRAIKGDSAGDSLRSPTKRDQFGIDNQATQSSPRRIFSSTSANSGTPCKAGTKRMAVATSPSEGLTLKSHQAKRRKYG